MNCVSILLPDLTTSPISTAVAATSQVRAPNAGYAQASVNPAASTLLPTPLQRKQGNQRQTGEHSTIEAAIAWTLATIQEMNTAKEAAEESLQLSAKQRHDQEQWQTRQRSLRRSRSAQPEFLSIGATARTARTLPPGSRVSTVGVAIVGPSIQASCPTSLLRLVGEVNSSCETYEQRQITSQECCSLEGKHNGGKPYMRKTVSFPDTYAVSANTQCLYGGRSINNTVQEPPLDEELSECNVFLLPGRKCHTGDESFLCSPTATVSKEFSSAARNHTCNVRVVESEIQRGTDLVNRNSSPYPCSAEKASIPEQALQPDDVELLLLGEDVFRTNAKNRAKAFQSAPLMDEDHASLREFLGHSLYMADSALAALASGANYIRSRARDLASALCAAGKPKQTHPAWCTLHDNHPVGQEQPWQGMQQGLESPPVSSLPSRLSASSFESTRGSFRGQQTLAAASTNIAANGCIHASMASCHLQQQQQLVMPFEQQELLISNNDLESLREREKHGNAVGVGEDAFHTAVAPVALVSATAPDDLNVASLPNIFDSQHRVQLPLQQQLDKCQDLLLGNDMEDSHLEKVIFTAIQSQRYQQNTRQFLQEHQLHPLQNLQHMQQFQPQQQQIQHRHRQQTPDQRILPGDGHDHRKIQQQHAQLVHKQRKEQHDGIQRQLRQQQLQQEEETAFEKEAANKEGECQPIFSGRSGWRSRTAPTYSNENLISRSSVSLLCDEDEEIMVSVNGKQNFEFPSERTPLQGVDKSYVSVAAGANEYNARAFLPCEYDEAETAMWEIGSREQPVAQIDADPSTQREQLFSSNVQLGGSLNANIEFQQLQESESTVSYAQKTATHSPAKLTDSMENAVAPVSADADAGEANNIDKRKEPPAPWTLLESALKPSLPLPLFLREHRLGWNTPFFAGATAAARCDADASPRANLSIETPECPNEGANAPQLQQETNGLEQSAPQTNNGSQEPQASQHISAIPSKSADSHQDVQQEHVQARFAAGALMQSQREKNPLPYAPGNVKLQSKETHELLHLQCRCKPCAFYYNCKGCRNGLSCQFCHHEDHSKLTLKQWKKNQHKLSRQLLYAKRSDVTPLEQTPENKPIRCVITQNY